MWVAGEQEGDSVRETRRVGVSQDHLVPGATPSPAHGALVQWLLAEAAGAARSRAGLPRSIGSSCSAMGEQVAVGVPTIGRQGMCLPPQNPQAGPGQRFDSFTDNPTLPTLFVVQVSSCAAIGNARAETQHALDLRARRRSCGSEHSLTTSPGLHADVRVVLAWQDKAAAYPAYVITYR